MAWLTSHQDWRSSFILSKFQALQRKVTEYSLHPSLPKYRWQCFCNGGSPVRRNTCFLTTFELFPNLAAGLQLLLNLVALLHCFLLTHFSSLQFQCQLYFLLALLLLGLLYLTVELRVQEDFEECCCFYCSKKIGTYKLKFLVPRLAILTIIQLYKGN